MQPHHKTFINQKWIHLSGFLYEFIFVLLHSNLELSHRLSLHIYRWLYEMCIRTYMLIATWQWRHRQINCSKDAKCLFRWNVIHFRKVSFLIYWVLRKSHAILSTPHPFASSESQHILLLCIYELMKTMCIRIHELGHSNENQIWEPLSAQPPRLTLYNLLSLSIHFHSHGFKF